jgi:hypothetical protein
MKKTRRRFRPLYGPAVAGTCFLALFATACGSASAPRVASIGTTTTPPKVAVASGSGPLTPGAAANDAEKFAACMRSHGVPNFPAPNIGAGHISIAVNPGLANSPHFKSAQAACQHLIPGKPGPAQISAQDQADYLKAAACMRSHGIAGFPDPVFPGPGDVAVRLPTGMDDNSPRFEAARAICEKLIPQGLPYSS